MERSSAKTEWEVYCENELNVVASILSRHEYILDEVQPHVKGERFLMNAVTTASGRKLILLGKNASSKRVVIKASKEVNGINEINHERRCRTILSQIDFARDIFHTPPEVAYIEEEGYVASIQEYIDQPSTFLERPLEAQFSFALAAFKGQEGAHATTYKHRALIANTFGIRDAKTYLKNSISFLGNVTKALPQEKALKENLLRAHTLLTENTQTIEQYCGFLTHTDFVPHNFRIREETMYLLDHSSLTFGNKYEGWARFLNFMTLYNPQLQKALEQYVRDNRTPEESVSLRLMRMYRLGEIIWYYVRTLDKSTENLFALNTERIYFWNTILEHLLDNKEIPESVITDYTTKRDSLRSDDEKARQKGLH